MPLTPDENAALIQRLGWTNPPPPPVAPPPQAAPPPMALSPLDQALVDANGGPRPPPVQRPPAPPSANAHVPGNYASALAPDQTVHVSGAAAAGAAPPPQGFTFPESPAGEGGGTTSGGSSRTVQKGTKISDETKALTNAGTATALDANTQEQQGQAAVSAAKVSGANQEAKLLGEQAQDNARLATETDEGLARKRAHLAQMVDDVNNEKVDPERFWHSRSTGQRIGIALSMIAGGFAGGWSGTGKNGAADMLDRAVQNDIHAQEETLANKRAGVQQQSQLYEMARGEFHDRQDRMKAMHVTALAQVGKQIDARIAEASDPIEKARLQSARAGIYQKAGEEHLRLDEVGSDKVSTTSHSTFTAAPKGAGGPSRKEFDALTEKLVLEKNLSVNEAHTLAAKMLQLPGAPAGDGKVPGGGKTNEAQGVLDANLAAINAAKKNVAQITAGGSFGAGAAHALPNWVPGVAEATKDASRRESYNNRARVSIAAAYKMGTDATEPKNAALLNKYAEPYEILPKDNEETALAKMDNLEQFLVDNGAAKGASGSVSGGSSYSYLKPTGRAR